MSQFLDMRDCAKFNGQGKNVYVIKSATRGQEKKCGCRVSLLSNK